MIEDDQIRAIVAVFERRCVKEKLIPFAVLGVSENGGQHILYDVDQSVDDIINALLDLAETLEKERRKSKEN